MRLTRVKVLLLQSDLHQYEIAASAGMSPITLSQIANGKRPPTARQLRALCQYFQLPPEEILGSVEVEIRDA